MGAGNESDLELGTTVRNTARVVKGNGARLLRNAMVLTLLLASWGCGGRTESMGDRAAQAGAGGSAGTRGTMSPATAGAPNGSAGARDAGVAAVVEAGAPTVGPADAGAVVADAGQPPAGPRPTCGGFAAPDTSHLCSGLLGLEFSRLTFAWLSASSAKVTVQIANAGQSFVSYPCFGITSDRPLRNTPVTLEPAVYVLLAGESHVYDFPVDFESPPPAGTVIHFTVWVDSQGLDCTEGGEFSFTEIAG